MKAISSYNPIRKTLFAFEHSEHENNTIIIGIEMQQKKDEIDLNNHFIAEDFKALSQHIKNSIKASLLITDSNVLHKEISNRGTDLEILSEAYPNLDLNDFYYQILKTTTKSFVAVCRKQYIHTLLEAYKKVNVFITDIHLGHLTAATVCSYIRESEFRTHNATIHSDQEEITSIHINYPEATDYRMGNMAIPSTHTLCFGAILGTLIDPTAISGNIEEKNIDLRHTFKESQFFKKTLQYGIGFLLLSLLINFFVFNNNYKTWQNLQEEQQVYTTQKENIEKRQSIVSTKENIVNSIINTGFSKSSFYIDQMIQSQPSTVVLTSLNYQPITKTIRNDKPIFLDTNTLQITGNSSEKSSFTAWVQQVEALDFVHQVTIINYGLDKKNTAAFEITITLVNDTEK